MVVGRERPAKIDSFGNYGRWRITRWVNIDNVECALCMFINKHEYLLIENVNQYSILNWSAVTHFISCYTMHARNRSGKIIQLYFVRSYKYIIIMISGLGCMVSAFPPNQLPPEKVILSCAVSLENRFSAHSIHMCYVIVYVGNGKWFSLLSACVFLTENLQYDGGEEQEFLCKRHKC